MVGGAQLPWLIPQTSVCAVKLAATLGPDSTRAGILQAQDSYLQHFWIGTLAIKCHLA